MMIKQNTRVFPFRISVDSKTRAVELLPLQARAERIQHGEPPPPGDGFHVYRLECSACVGFFATNTSHDQIPAEIHSQWFEETLEHFREHYVDHPGRVAPCGGECLITCDGQPFVVPSRDLTTAEAI